MANANLGNHPHRVPVIGLVGGIAAGKSHVSGLLQELGCALIDADRIGHELLGDLGIRRELESAFGPTIIAPDGSIDRGRLGGLVFGRDQEHQARRQRLEAILHPAIRATATARMAALQSSPTPPQAIVLDVPLLLEAGWDRLCDWIFFVDTAESLRRQRAEQRGWDEPHWREREQAQWPVEAKRQAATHLIPGDLPRDALLARLRQLLEEMQSR